MPTDLSCATCHSLRAQLADRDARIQDLVEQLRETLKFVDALQADLDRVREDAERQRPNTPERVAKDELQLAFEHVLSSQPELAKAVANDTTIESTDAEHALGRTAAPDDPEAKKRKNRANRKPHGRRGAIDLSKLPSRHIVIDAPEVMATGGEGWICIGEEISHRLGYRPGSFLDLVLVRRKHIRVAQPVDAGVERDECTEVVIAPLPDSFLPRIMADTSVIAHIAVSKYGDSLPLNRQETISARQGFELPRSSQCDWLVTGYNLAYRVVDAMFSDARANAQYIATDATTAPVRGVGKCENWHHFVFIAERDHVIFRYAREHTGPNVTKMLQGFRGYLLADAAVIYDTLYRNCGMIECGCWSHARRYLWRALCSDRLHALEGLALVAKIFEADRLTADLPNEVRTRVRAERAGPILDALDTWIEGIAPSVDPRGPMHKAIGYLRNQREALRRFLEHGALPVHNNQSEAQLRAPVLGRANWTAFENETGLKLYSTYRSLIASCALHGLNPETYLEQLLRLVPHWSARRVIELAPKYWKKTVANLDPEQHRIITAPWELDPALLALTTPKPRRIATSSAA